MSDLEIKNITIAGTNVKDLSLGFNLGSVVFVNFNNLADRLSFLECLAGVKKPASGKIFYKQMDIYKFNKSFNKRGRVFVKNITNYCYNKRFLIPRDSISLHPQKTLWQNLKRFSKINKNPEFMYSIVHYFLFHEIVDKKCNKITDTEKHLAMLSTVMFFDNIDLWIIYIDDTIITDPADAKIIRHLLHSRANDCDGLVVYTTKTGSSIDIPSEINL
jgi:ABC-type transport system involved in cytochrome c biogenesis ATPase subunit